MADLGPICILAPTLESCKAFLPAIFHVWAHLQRLSGTLSAPDYTRVYNRIQIYGVRSYTPLKARANPTPSAINAEVTVLLAYEQLPIPDVN